MAACIELVFRIQVTLDLLYTVFQGNYTISKHIDTVLKNFVPKSGLRKLGHGMSTVLQCDEQDHTRGQVLLIMLRDG